MLGLTLYGWRALILSLRSGDGWVKVYPYSWVKRNVSMMAESIQYNTIQYNAMQYNTIQYNTIQYNTIQYNTIQYNTIQYNTIQYNTIQYNTIGAYSFCGLLIVTWLYRTVYHDFNCKITIYKCLSLQAITAGSFY